jgi:hypothetical protein
MNTYLGLKRKFSFSYFREKFFSLFAKKAYENFQFRENFPFGMRIRIQEPPKCVSRSETLVENFYKNGNFTRKPSREQKFFAKTFVKTKISAKRNIAKFREKLANFRFSRKRKKGFLFQPYTYLDPPMQGGESCPCGR